MEKVRFQQILERGKGPNRCLGGEHSRHRAGQAKALHGDTIACGGTAKRVVRQACTNMEESSGRGDCRCNGAGQ